jgi:hypothetical protein
MEEYDSLDIKAETDDLSELEQILSSMYVSEISYLCTCKWPLFVVLS